MAGRVPAGWAASENAPVTTPPAAPDAQDAFERRLSPLWRRAHDGDEAAYREALALIALRLRAYLRRRLAAQPAEVEDLVQETLLALHLHRGSWDPALPASAWVLAVARHKLIDFVRRHGRRDALHAPLDEVDENELAAAAADAGAARDLAVLLQALPAAQRDAIVLTRLEGLSVAEAAARTGASVPAIKVQVHRGLKRLAALVRREG
ncbi:RNA polymerase subunit sigma [Rubrivivax gelatinosus]|nr:RNA polymerase subunit sigma [Rubrivivax gelatinosus]